MPWVPLCFTLFDRFDPVIADPVDPVADLKHTGPIGSDDAGAAFYRSRNIFQDLPFCFYVQGAGSFVKQEDWRIGKERSCNTYPL